MKLSAFVIACAFSSAGQATVTVTDDANRTVTLPHPAQRVIAFAPHITELLFAAGAGDHVVGAMNFSDYPEAARKIPLIGSHSQIDVERVLALKPELLVVWQSGNTARQLEQLNRLGIPIFYSEPRSLEDVATNLERLGQLTGTAAQAAQAAQRYRAQLASLRATYAQRPPVKVFYQVWDKPVYTLNGKHIASDALRVCGGVNVFADLRVLAPEVSTEAVLQANPEVMFGSELNGWKQFKTLTAVQRNNLFSSEGEHLTRATPRIADATRAVCEQLEQARRKRR